MRYWPDSQRVAGTSKAEVLVILSAQKNTPVEALEALHQTSLQYRGTRLWHKTLAHDSLWVR